jgi:hypothetical protein
MKHAQTCLSFASAGLVLAGSTPVVRAGSVVISPLTSEVSGRDLDVLFDPIDDVSELVEISAGSVYLDEGGSLTISAIMDDNSLFQLFSEPNITNHGFFTTVNLSTITGNNFTALSVPGTVKGLRFDLEGIWSPETTLPASTTFTFTTVPEPSTTLLSIAGLAFLSFRRKRT